MGIRGLQTWVYGGLKLHGVPSDPKNTRIIVLDGLAFVRSWYPPSIDWIRGGQWLEGEELNSSHRVRANMRSARPHVSLHRYAV